MKARSLHEKHTGRKKGYFWIDNLWPQNFDIYVWENILWELKHCSLKLKQFIQTRYISSFCNYFYTKICNVYNNKLEYDTWYIKISFIYQFLADVISLSKCIHFPLANESFMPKTIFIQKWKEDVGNEGSQLPFLGIQNKPIVTPNISMCVSF